MMHYIVNQPVVDLRAEPSEPTSGYEIDRLQETQALYGELVSVEREQMDWLFVKALEQKKCLQDGSWSGYPGWVKKSTILPTSIVPKYNLVVKAHVARIKADEPFEVTLGCRLESVGELANEWILRLVSGEEGTISKNDVWDLSVKPDPDSILEYGRRMIGFPYFWGGRSAFCPDKKTSIDCSGFVNLLYRIHGIDIPRDAHDQYLSCKLCGPEELAAGDLVFMASEKGRMNHVMIYSGEGRLLEATAASRNVREIRAEERFGSSLSEAKNIYFGKVMI